MIDTQGSQTVGSTAPSREHGEPLKLEIEVRRLERISVTTDGRAMLSALLGTTVS